MTRARRRLFIKKRPCVNLLPTGLMETTHLIPILIFNDTLGSTLLPRGIEAQDFQTALAATSDPADRTLVDTWYRLDQKTQPACYRLQSSASMVSRTRLFVLGELNRWLQQDPSIQRRLLEIFISIFSPELSDAYLTTLFEQEVHNSVCMSQELARRCVWIQHGAACPVPPAADGCIIEQENRRRVNATQKALKVFFFSSLFGLGHCGPHLPLATKTMRRRLVGAESAAGETHSEERMRGVASFGRHLAIDRPRAFRRRRGQGCFSSRTLPSTLLSGRNQSAHRLLSAGRLVQRQSGSGSHGHQTVTAAIS